MQQQNFGNSSVIEDLWIIVIDDDDKGYMIKIEYS